MLRYLRREAGLVPRRAQDLAAALVLVSNQGVIGRELATEADIMVIHAMLRDVLSKHGIALDAI